jgi:hypothetical protein
MHANKEKAKTKPEKANQVLDVFFKLHAPLNPSTVSAPPPIRPGKCPGALAPDDPQAYPEPAEQPAGAAAVESSKVLSGQVTTGVTVLPGQSTASQLPAQHVVDKNAISLLQDLKAAVKCIPSDTPSATPEHRLSAFSVDPCTCVAKPGEDDWLILNQMMKSSFGWGEQEMASNIPHLLNLGLHRLGQLY